jgi:hypothetical protein
MKTFGKCLEEQYPCDLASTTRLQTDLAYPRPQLNALNGLPSTVHGSSLTMMKGSIRALVTFRFGISL